MATLRQIQRRIRSVQSTAKTTRALSLVAGSKMRRDNRLRSHFGWARRLREHMNSRHPFQGCARRLAIE